MFFRNLIFSLMLLASLAVSDGWAAPGEAIRGELQPSATVQEPAAPVTPADGGGAASSPAGGQQPVSWWRPLVHKIGLAPDPNPGETALPALERPQASSDYIIGPGDLLGISVWRDENLTRAVVVLSDGKISYPLVGELTAGGKTVAQLKQEIETKLSRYVTDAGLTVEVKQSNSMIVYVIGRVNAPGKQMLLASTNVLQGLAMAGGLNPFAQKDEVKIFRAQGGRTRVFTFNYQDVVEGRHLETNIELKRGDVILVP